MITANHLAGSIPVVGTHNNERIKAVFEFLNSTLKAAASVVDIPVSIAADAITLGGTLTDKETTYTSEAAGRLVQNVKDMTDPEK